MNGCRWQGWRSLVWCISHNRHLVVKLFPHIPSQPVKFAGSTRNRPSSHHKAGHLRHHGASPDASRLGNVGGISVNIAAGEIADPFAVAFKQRLPGREEHHGWPTSVTTLPAFISSLFIVRGRICCVTFIIVLNSLLFCGMFSISSVTNHYIQCVWRISSRSLHTRLLAIISKQLTDRINPYYKHVHKRIK